MTKDDMHSNMWSWDELADDYLSHTQRIAELETQLENARRLLQISDERATRLSGKVDELEARLAEANNKRKTLCSLLKDTVAQRDS